MSDDEVAEVRARVRQAGHIPAAAGPGLQRFRRRIRGDALIAGGSRKASTRELEDWARALSTAHASAEIAKQVSGALNEEYQRALNRRTLRSPDAGFNVTADRDAV